MARHAWASAEWVEDYVARYGFPPIAGGAPDDDDTAKDDEQDEGKDDSKPADEKDTDDDKVSADDDWQVKARKHERALKRERKAREAAEAKLQERETADLSEQEQAIERAKQEARDEAKAEGEKERRGDRLENASMRLAAKGFEIGEGDDAQTVRFADPDDALIYVERAIRSGDVDEDDIFDSEGKVQQDALKDALADILASKPHLRADGKDNGKPKGSADTRKGDKASTDLESMTPEDHARRKYGAAK